MTVLLDADHLRTFAAIAETGSFTKAAEVVHKTQSAVSMQMKRLEDRVGRPLFARDGRASRLTPDGEKLLDYARRIVKLNLEAVSAFTDQTLSGRVCLGVPDDYADRYLPDIMARFSRTHPSVELTVVCEPSQRLNESIAAGAIDLAIITATDISNRNVQVIRRERLLWVGSLRHSAHLEEPTPLALGQPTCQWRDVAVAGLHKSKRGYRILYSSPNHGAVSAAVLAGLAISVVPESALRPGMRVLGAAEGFPPLPPCDIGLLRNPHEPSALAEALAHHIIQGLDNLTEADAAE
ncbi:MULTISPECIES: LysR substrate-binding domain-containing protein [Azorhizobium]|uniref:Transcriptional regulator n=1 Tax=Azorhizobium caulinodans (strain ATCC 43989 / DSM 5975 / JCM 20966 / LMG 6465 / NBRC 14845 / NCIMB 13405 / ORS 571) TaxID=438753 RepID=A8IDN0_AZOC5|nr:MULTISPECIES: LysR substrate-binding domain-containing protein [Azorhizobium]TDT93418.1 transcriptional regulator [Azorhizobium sp. AG788]BAF88964.1 transcriptional regulator [Azorhizobium caulinodans ORS 571]